MKSVRLRCEMGASFQFHCDTAYVLFMLEISRPGCQLNKVIINLCKCITKETKRLKSTF